MCNRYLGLLLLIWCPGELHAQSATQSCSAPSLNGGKFSPKRETYAHGTYVTYSCDLGRKPAVEGWWARSTCQNGTWSPQPRCIMERDCMPPKIPNAKYTESLTGWYRDGDKIRITCDEAYEPKNNDATALCTNGSWPSVPVCERSADACDAPPKVPHAVIVDHGYQELFAADTQLQYECEEGYTAEGAGNDKTIMCIAGTWTEGPTCINICGDPPKIPKAVVVQTFRRSVKYSCQQYYKRLGPESVRCYSDGTWSELPTCEASYCVVNTHEYPDLKPAGEIYLEDGDTVRLECADRAEWWFINYSDGECNNGIIHLSRCCAKAQLALNTCDGFLTKRN